MKMLCMGEQLFSLLKEENDLADHILELSFMGYGFTSFQVCLLAASYAEWLGKKESLDKLSLNWFYKFMSRHPELSVTNPKSLSSIRASAASPDCIDTYFTKLREILEKYDLVDAPSRIYNIDDKGFNTAHKPLHIVSQVS